MEHSMNVTEAVKTAKTYVRDVFVDEKVADPGPEEAEFDEAQGIRAITIGFTRFWNSPNSKFVDSVLGRADAVPYLGALNTVKRTYKVIRIDNAGEVISLKNRSSEIAAE